MKIALDQTSVDDYGRFSPFTGIGSEGYTAIKLGRRFYGCELKDEYHAAAMRNMERAVAEREQAQCGLFS
jgi:DNA modification methylase